MLEVPPEGNAVPDLIMEDEEGMMIMEIYTKEKRDEVAQGRRKHPKEDDIRPEKHISRNPTGFYSEDWDEFQQEEDEWQTPDKWQRISQMVFHGRCLEINPDEARYISSSCTQHQGGGCSISTAYID